MVKSLISTDYIGMVVCPACGTYFGYTGKSRLDTVECTQCGFNFEIVEHLIDEEI